MGMKFLWDTNTAIYYLQSLFPANAEAYIDRLVSDNVPIISVITEIELLCWKTSNNDDLKLLNEFIADVCVIELDQDTKRQTAELRKRYRIKLPDAIIAATALVNGLTLITRNVSDFKDIVGLTVINPWDL